MAKYLGPLSAISGGNRLFYVDLNNQLNTNEKLTSIDGLGNSHIGQLTISGASILSGTLLTKDGHALYSGEAVQFWASSSGNINILASLTIPYHTNFASSDTCLVYLKVVPSI